MKTLKEFLSKNFIAMKSPIKISKRPDNLMDDMPKGSTHWEIRLKRFVRHTSQPRILKIYFSQGPAYKESPTIFDVFSCLVDDVLLGSYIPSEFMDEFYYDDPKEAKKIYDACVKTHQKMLDFLGAELLEEVTYNVET